MRISIISIMLVLGLLIGCKSTKVPAVSNEDKVVMEARTYIGVPYKYGGVSKSGMDCSGLLLRSFETIDYPMPRTTKDQIRLGKKVGVSSVQKGDLVFFKAEKGRNKVTHVGLVTAVVSPNDIRFIHSSTKLGVVESNLLSDYYKKIFLQARRIL